MHSVPLPNEIWLYIISLLPSDIVKRLYPVNHIFLHLALSKRYKTVNLARFGWKKVDDVMRLLVHLRFAIRYSLYSSFHFFVGNPISLTTSNTYQSLPTGSTLASIYVARMAIPFGGGISHGNRSSTNSSTFSSASQFLLNLSFYPPFI
jgi:hypothetical protein